jgi:hypothetical protein
LTARVCFTLGAWHFSHFNPFNVADPDGLDEPWSRTITGEIQAQQLVFLAGAPAPLNLPGNGQSLIFGLSQSPLVPEVYGNFDEDCNAPDRPRTNVN